LAYKMITASVKRMRPISNIKLLQFRRASGLVTTALDNGLFYVGINSPGKRNAVNLETACQLFEAFSDFNENKEAQIAILHGHGGTFCAGFDLKQLGGTQVMNVDEIDRMFEGRAPLGPSRMVFKKPTIAAISGYAVAGGFELSLMCDLRIMEEDAIVGVFCRRFGVPLMDGGTVRLPKLIGLSRALDLILTGRPVAAKEASKMGIVNRVVPRGESLAEASKLARQLLKFPQECMLADRISAYNAAYSGDSIEDLLQYEYKHGLKVIAKESVPGAKKFISGKGRKGKFE